ncbi:hypothetical protein IGI04_022726 [Brassica rapa subsp. trilocularis]|uniref:Uncharacterized protein n=1 Tax=Brassica rapa subsp. trilocularis TaxID=1813537 RepID=A0ABQ7M1S2_BRACM|nr:hypothetical protein IGI04_022726 [Brassica rapa subsp. trilocularis]
MHFMLEDFSRSLPKYSVQNFSDLSPTLENFSKDFWKTLGRLLAKLLIHFMLEDFPQSFQEVFCPK